MDAYELQQKLLNEWRNLALVPNADSAKKTYNEVPVYVEIYSDIYKVADIVVRDGKILLELV